MTGPSDDDSPHVLGELIPCGGGDPIPLLHRQLLIGRRASCDISLAFPNVSSHHCELELHNGYWRVRDVGSRNGIKVNGQRCDANWLLPGDILHIAKHRYEISYEPAGDAPPPAEHDPMEMSLMEKAGLVQRERRPSEKSPPSSPTKPSTNRNSSSGTAGSSPAETEDDSVLRWLTEDSDD